MGETTKWIYIYNPPPGRAEFANVYFPDLVRRGRAIEIYSSYRDIYKLLDKEVLDEINKDKAQDLEYYKYEYLGEVFASRGLVYPQFRREKHVKNIYELIAHGDKVVELLLGLDEGTINDSTCVTALAVLFSGVAVVLDCFENDPLVAGQQSPSEQSRALIRFVNELLEKFEFLRYVPRHWIFECAEGGQMLKLQFEQDTHGMERCDKVTQKNIMGDIKRVRSMLSEGILFFHVAPNVNTEQLCVDIENYVFDEEKNTIKKGQRDDTIDSLEYVTKLYYNAPISAY